MSGLSKVSDFDQYGTSYYNLWFALPITLIGLPLALKFARGGLLLPLNLILPGLLYFSLLGVPLYLQTNYWVECILGKEKFPTEFMPATYFILLALYNVITLATTIDIVFRYYDELSKLCWSVLTIGAQNLIKVCFILFSFKLNSYKYTG